MTIVEIDDIITDLKAAYKASLSGKSYTISTAGNSRSLTRNDSDKLRAELQYWETERARLVNNTTGIPMKFITEAAEN